GQGLHDPGADVETDNSLAATVLDYQRGHEELVVAVDLLVLERGLEGRVEHVEAALIGGEAGPPGGHAAKGPHRDVAVGLAAPRAAPVLELDDLERRLADEDLDHVLVGQVVAALDGVEGVAIEG